MTDEESGRLPVDEVYPLDERVKTMSQYELWAALGKCPTSLDRLRFLEDRRVAQLIYEAAIVEPRGKAAKGKHVETHDVMEKRYP